MPKKIARVFPRKTAATPDDDLVFFDIPPLLGLPEIDEVHISVCFTWDRKKAESLAYQWEVVGVPVKIGGPAYDDPAEGEFYPGMYLKKGYVITSRGCNNKCWFCLARKREGTLRELEIKDGWDVLDNNLLQCSESHIRAVFEIQLTRSDITAQLSKLTGLTQQELRRLFQEAAAQAIQADDEIYRAVGLSPGSPNDSPELLQLLSGGMQQTSGTFQNLTRTTANTATQQFERALDRAWLQVSSGAFNYQSAIRTAIKSLASTGMQAIQYPTGHIDTLEVAVRRAVLTGVGKTTGEICLAHAEEMGCDLMEITAHPGARPSHMEWQGKIVSLSGRNGYLSKSDIGYGTGNGFKGWNCRHDWFPYFEGLSESAYPREKLREYENQTVTYNGKTLSYYDATQQQRYIERQIRRWKREYQMMDAAGQDTTQASMKLAQWRAAEKDFCKQTGLDRDGFRSQVEGFGRSEASRATWEAKKLESAANSLFSYGNTEKNMAAYLKDKAVIDMLSEHGVKYIQRISEKEIIVDAGKPTITGMRVHAVDNLINKPDRAGMTQEQAQIFVDSAKLTLYQQDRKNLKFLAQNGYSILNLNHELVTAVPQKWRKKYDQYLEVIKS